MGRPVGMATESLLETLLKVEVIRMIRDRAEPTKTPSSTRKLRTPSSTCRQELRVNARRICLWQPCGRRKVKPSVGSAQPRLFLESRQAVNRLSLPGANVPRTTPVTLHSPSAFMTYMVFKEPSSRPFRLLPPRLPAQARRYRHPRGCSRRRHGGLRSLNPRRGSMVGWLGPRLHMQTFRKKTRQAKNSSRGVVEFVFGGSSDSGKGDHPFGLHGYPEGILNQSVSLTMYLC